MRFLKPCVWPCLLPFISLVKGTHLPITIGMMLQILSVNVQKLIQISLHSKQMPKNISSSPPLVFCLCGLYVKHDQGDVLPSHCIQIWSGTVQLTQTTHPAPMYF